MRIIPVRPERLSDKVVKQILQMIHDGELVPGGKLPNETILSEQFGVSRGVMREAMTQLQVAGYVRRKPKDGTYIQDKVNDTFSRPVADAFKKATYNDLLDFRESLETKMVEIIIDRASDEEIAELLECLEPASSNEQMDSMDHYFHYKLAQASRNVFFMNFIDTYYDLIQEISQKSNHDQIRRNQIVQEHREVVLSIAKRNKKAAREAMAHHMDMVRRIEALSEQEE